MSNAFAGLFSPQPGRQHVLVLSHSDGSGIQGIWGPYANEQMAECALGELQNWPIQGAWDIVELKPFPAPGAATATCR